MHEKATVYLLRLSNHDVHEQLLLEEALLHATNQSYCILNHGSPPRIVMGISGKPKELINLGKMATSPIPIIKRYSGGGTVIVDSNTFFVSFIFQKDVLPFPCYPEPILRYSEKFYQKALSIPTFHLRENDYVIGDKKCGGNAQYIKKNRFTHHTTFLWDYAPSRMDYLLYPQKTPKYRSRRSHQEFLCPLKNYLPSKEAFFQNISFALQTEYTIKELPVDLVSFLLSGNHRKTTTQIKI